MPLKDRIRHWLGLDLLPTRDMLNALELRERQRHELLMGMLNRVEQRLINAHAFDRPINHAIEQLDWDTVQAIALQQLQANPEKEN